MTKRLYAVRGAIQVESDDRDNITTSVVELYRALCDANALEMDSIVSWQFTITPDLRSLNPATALRTIEGTAHIPLFCMQEPVVEGMLERTIRCMVLHYAPIDHISSHIYLGGAKILRPDISDGC